MSQSAEGLFARVIEHVRDTSLLETTSSVLEWDERTGMPEEGGEFRAAQVTFLSGLIHTRRTEKWLGDALEKLAESDLYQDNHSEKGSTIRGLKKDYDRNVKLPEDLVKAIAKATVVGQQVWAKARPANDFKMFLPCLREIVALRKKEAGLLQGSMKSPYDALIDQYEEGATTEQIQPVFAALRDQLVTLIKKLVETGNAPDGKSLAQPFDIPTQRRFSKFIAEKIGFEFSRGRLDETDHPFCTTLGPNDQRILTRYQSDHFSSGLFGTLHEAGHGMYEQGLNRDWFFLPPGSAVSLGVHESQSRLWENIVGRSREFWSWCLPLAKEHFPTPFATTSVDTIYRDLNRVQPSLIRVDADEATYNLHILIRFELEQELINDSLDPADLPSAWGDRYQKYLGVKVPDDRDGVLQDVHWSAALFGYFPTYTLGNIYSAQLVNAAESQIPELRKQWTRGEFQPLLEWLRWNVHRFGRRLSPTELIKQSTGQAVSAAPLVDYLHSKLSEVYKL